MFSFETMLLGVALAIDASVASFAIGLLDVGSSPVTRTSRGLMVALAFGFFQFLMLWLGSYGGYLFSFSSYGYMFQVVVAGLFFVIALKLVQESFEEEDFDFKWGALPLFIISLATSIDALAAGVSLGTLPRAYLSALEVGMITFFLCAVAYFSTAISKNIPKRWLLRLASGVFFFLGGEIIYTYIF